MSAPVGRRLVSLSILAGALTPLAGCGFQPVYMGTASDKAGPAQRNLAAIHVALIPDRPGQELREALKRSLGSDSGVPPRYELAVAFGVSGEGIGIQANNLATRLRLISQASYTLRRLDAKQTVLFSGAARAMDGVNVFDSQYFAADLEVEAEEKRMANEIAQQIAMQLAVFFRSRAAKRNG